jgi:adenylate kinase family enzyme
MASDLSATIYFFFRSNIVGSSGSGKSTVGKLIAKKFGFPYIELDKTQQKPSWTESIKGELSAKLERPLKDEIWVLDGNYSKTVPIK